MILVIDNYDSFTFNLVHYISNYDKNIKVIRNDEMHVGEALDLNPTKIVISPGPCTPSEAGISVEVIRQSDVPLLGVCLGHQSIGSAFGGNIVEAPEIFHGKKSLVQHNKSELFSGIKNSFEVVRYHSLIIEHDTLPSELQITSWVEGHEDLIMSVEHKSRPIYGIQFHPESIETNQGMDLIQNFMEI